MSSSFDVLLAVLAGTLVVLGLTNRLAKQYTLSPYLLAVVVGIVLGPVGLGVADPTAGAVGRATLLEQASRLALALTVTTIGFRVRRSDLRANGRRVGSLLGVGMPVMWLVTALGAWLLLDLPWPVALLLGAVLTPTDPAVAAALTQGTFARRMLPDRLRKTLEMESGANDGLAVALVLVAAFFVAGAGAQTTGGLLVTLAREVGLPLLIGPAIGAAVGALSRFARQRDAIEETFVPILAPATSLFVLAVSGLVHASGVFAAFLAGLAMSWVASDSAVRESVAIALENFTRVATIAVFLVFGAVIPWDGWTALGGAAFGFVAWVLLLRRPLAGVAALLPTGTGPLSTAFLSWFGPLGAGSLYYITYIEHYGLPEQERLFAVATLVVACSMLAHTLTSAPSMHGYARRTGSQREEGEESTLPGRLP